MAAAFTAAGYLIGTLLALTLDRLYTGAPVRGPIVLCKHDLPRRCWLGTAGYLLARGRCPSGCRLPARLWYLPLIGAVAGMVIALRAVDIRHAVVVASFSTVLLAFVATDFERHLLPNRLMYPALAAAVALCWVWPGRGPASSLEGGALGLGLMFVLFMVAPGFGFGDVKLAGLLGLVAGLPNTLPALTIGAVAGGVAIALMLLTRRARLHTGIAYGPYLALGAFIGMLAR